MSIQEKKKLFNNIQRKVLVDYPQDQALIYEFNGNNQLYEGFRIEEMKKVS